jgi:hypothetical protein
MPAKTRIQESAAATIKRLGEKDRGLGQMLKKAYGYAVFPAVGKASLVVGGSYGRGAVFERGKFIGHATLSQLTLGVQVGGDTFSEILVFENKEALDRLKKGKMSFAANASAVLVKAGAAGTKNFTNGVAAYAYSRGGMLLEAVLGGQKFSFKPADEEDMEDQGEEEGEEQQESSRGGSKGKPDASRGEESDEGDEEGQEGEEDSGESEDGGEDEEAGVLGRAMGGVKSAASSVSETAKAHPVAATVIGTALVASAAFFVVRAIRGRSDQDEEGQEDQEDNEAQDQADEGEEDEEKGDTLNQLRRRRSRA